MKPQIIKNIIFKGNELKFFIKICIINNQLICINSHNILPYYENIISSFFLTAKKYLDNNNLEELFFTHKNLRYLLLSLN